MSYGEFTNDVRNPCNNIAMKAIWTNQGAQYTFVLYSGTTNTFSRTSYWVHHIFLDMIFPPKLGVKSNTELFSWLAYGNCVPFVKIRHCVIFLLVKSMWVNYNSFSLHRHFFVKRAILFKVYCSFLVECSLCLCVLSYSQDSFVIGKRCYSTTWGTIATSLMCNRYKTGLKTFPCGFD